jgi:hypothetical protein
MEKSKGGINPIFFLDRTHGKRTSQILQRVGMNVVLHSKWFIQEARDPEWIAKCGLEEWIVLSGDKSIESVPENRQAVIDAKVKVFFFNDTSSLPEEWAAAVIVGRPRIFDIIERNNGPFFVTIDKNTRSHISSVRFVGSGGAKTAETGSPSEAPTAIEPSPPPPASQPIQLEIWTKKSK